VKSLLVTFGDRHRLDGLVVVFLVSYLKESCEKLQEGCARFGIRRSEVGEWIPTREHLILARVLQRGLGESANSSIPWKKIGVLTLSLLSAISILGIPILV
jgi:hypothetical protein